MATYKNSYQHARPGTYDWKSKTTTTTNQNKTSYQHPRPGTYDWEPPKGKVAEVTIFPPTSEPLSTTPATNTKKKTTPGATSTIPEAVFTPISNTLNWGPPAQTMMPDYGDRPIYTRSAELEELYRRMKEHEANKPGEYKSSYDEQIKGLLEKIENRDAFAYDPADDPLYQVYKDQYVQGGKLAMQDAMGSAAALTGGYGSSYGQQVGQQTYQQHMQDLTARIPELAQAAYAQYQAEGANMFDKLNMYQGLDAADYEKYAGRVNEYYQQLGYDMNKYGMMSNEELTRYQQELAAWQADRDYAFAMQQAALEQSQWDKQFAYQQQQDALSQSNWEREFALARAKANSSGGSSKKSEAYATILKNAANMTGEQQQAYLKRMQDLGYVTSGEAMDIFEVGLAGGINASDANKYSLKEALTAISTIIAENGQQADVTRAINEMASQKLIDASTRKELEANARELFRQKNARYK